MSKKLSDEAIARQYGIGGVIGRMMRNWLYPEKKQLYSEHRINVPSDSDMLDKLHTRVKDAVMRRPAARGKGGSLGDQWVAFESSLLSVMAHFKGAKCAFEVSLTYEGADLWASNYYTLEVRTKKSDAVLTTVNIYGLN